MAYGTWVDLFFKYLSLSSWESLHTRTHRPLLTETFLGEFGGPFHRENKHKPRGQETPRLWGTQCLRRDCPCPFWTQHDCYGRDTIIWAFTPKRTDFSVNQGDRNRHYSTPAISKAGETLRGQMSLRPGRACLPASRVPRTAPAPTSPVHIFFPKMLEIAGPGVRKRAESCRLTEPEGRARDAAGAADGSGLRRGRSFRPRAESNPTARPPPRSRGEIAEPRACCPPAALSPFPGSLPGHRDREAAQGWSRAETGSDRLD